LGAETVQVTISARHGHLSEASQDRIKSKVERFERLFERLAAIEVTADLEHEDKPSVTIHVSAEHKHDFVATETDPNLMAAIDKAVDKIEHQLRKYKEKVQERHRGPGRVEE
jgi:putative sigma-54 modulation protein